MKTTKKQTTKNIKTLITAAIRKIWRTFPVRAEAIKIACVNPEAKVYDRKYKCSCCGQDFFLQQVEVNHKESAKKDESFDEKVDRIFLGVKSWKGDEFTLKNGLVTTPESLADMFLEVVCKSCHKEITKKQKKERG